MESRVVTADLHSHLLEKKVKPLKYWQGVQKAGLDVIAITEHAEYNPKKAFELVNEKKPEGILLIPGTELFTSLGHVIALGESSEIYEIPELLEKGVSIEKAVELARENRIVLSFAHPWGFDSDSVAYVGGVSKLRHYAVHGSMGVEAYNGMIGTLAESVLRSKWVKKPIGFFAYMEKNRLSRSAGIGKIMGSIKKKLDKKAYDIIQRNLNAMEFGEEANFITAGSDAHFPDRIGTGILKLKVSSERILSEASFLEALKDKSNVIWAGPPSVEVKEGVFQKKRLGVKKSELLGGFKYVMKRRIFRRKKPKSRD